jgi:O-antigen ligase
MSFGAHAVCFLFTSQYLLVEHEFWGISPRIVAVGTLTGLLALNFRRVPRIVAALPDLLGVYSVWIIFIAWMAFAGILNGDANVSSVFLSTLVSNFIFPFISCLAIPVALKTQKDTVQVMSWILCIAVFNAVFVILQSTGYMPAWEFNRALFPLRTNQIEASQLVQGESFTFGYPPGLSTYSITTGFVLACFGAGFLLRGIWGWHARNMWSLTMNGVGYLLVMTACALAMSRSSLLLLLACAGAASLTKNKQGERSVTLIAVVAAIIVIAICIGVSRISTVEINVSETRFRDLGRMADLEDSSRSTLVSEALAFIIDHPWFGGVTKALDEQLITLTPHNFLLNAGVAAGLPGCALVILFYLWLIKFIVKTSRLLNTKGDYKYYMWFLGLEFGMWVYLLKGLVHSDSFSLGGTLGWYLFGLMVASLLPQKNLKHHCQSRASVNSPALGCNGKSIR